MSLPPPGERFTIFHLDDERGFRGGERQLLYVAAGLRARGHDNVVCCRGGTPLEREARRLGFEVLVLPFRWEFDLESARRLAAAARRRRRPVIHAHTGHTVGIAAACRLFDGPRAIAHRRGAFRLRGGFSRWFKYDRVARVVAVSRAIADILRRSGLPDQRAAVVPDCIPVSQDEWRAAGYDHPRFAPASTERRSAARRVLAHAHGIDPSQAWVGNLAALVPLKDHTTLIAAAAAVLRRRPDTVFLIAGEGPERERLQTDIDRRAHAGRVVLLGHYDAAELFSAIDLFVLSSTCEGMGSVLLEAASCGVPVVATAVGGIPEVVRDGQTGLLVPPRDAEGMSHAITRLLEEPVLARRLSAAARDSLAQFGLAAAVGRMEPIYAEAAPAAEARRSRVAAGSRLAWRLLLGPLSAPRWALATATLMLLAATATWQFTRSRSQSHAARQSAAGANRAGTPSASARTTDSLDGVSFGGDLTELSEQDIRDLMGVMDSLRALPSSEPDESAVLAMGRQGPQGAKAPR